MEFLPTFGTRWVFMSDLSSLSGSGSGQSEPRCSLKQAHIPTYVTHGGHNETKYNTEIDLQSCSVVSSVMEHRSVQLCVYIWTHCSVEGIVWWAASNVYNSRLRTTGFMPVTTSSVVHLTSFTFRAPSPTLFLALHVWILLCFHVTSSSAFLSHSLFLALPGSCITSSFICSSWGF